MIVYYFYLLSRTLDVRMTVLWFYLITVFAPVNQLPLISQLEGGEGRRAPKESPLSIADLHFSIMGKRQYCALV